MPNKIRNLVGFLERANVIADVVVRRDGQQDNVGRVFPDMIAKRD